MTTPTKIVANVLDALIEEKKALKLSMIYVIKVASTGEVALLTKLYTILDNTQHAIETIAQTLDFECTSPKPKLTIGEMAVEAIETRREEQ